MKNYKTNKKLAQAVFMIALLLCFFPFVDPSIALLAGFICTLIFGNPFLKQTSRAVSLLLQFSIVGLGFGMNIYDAAEVGKTGLSLTIASILITLGVGLLLGKLFRIGKKTNLLISVGTAICGGSAIAAIAPIIKSKEEETSISLACIFLLNAVALFLFPYIGTLLALTQEQFGLWAAIAIHDTSSVVGAAQKYGEEALQIATTVKLERALWIIPISFITAICFKNDGQKIKVPYFIFLFVLAMLINSFVPQISPISPHIVFLAKKGLTVTLFLIGAGLTLSSIKKVGIKPLLQGIILWVFISASSLLIILKCLNS